MESGTLVEWQVKPGDQVRRGQTIATVETQKGLFEVESFEEGLVEQLLVQPGTMVPVGTVLATLRGEWAPSEPAPRAPRPAAPAATAVEAPPGPAAAPSTKEEIPPPPLPGAVPSPPHRMLISPSARRLAEQLGIDAATVKGGGPHGAVQRADVERAAAEREEKKEAAPAPAPPAPEMPPAEKPAGPDYQTAMRQAIAAAMSRSNREIPHYYLGTDIDLSPALCWLESENLKRAIKDRMLPVVLLLKAVARALVDVPELNGYWIDNRLQVQESINIGFAITLRQGGLITPAIHGVDLLSLDDLMVALRDLISRTRSGHLRSSEMTDATITVTSLGDLGVTTAFGVIYPPQVALVGFGRISERPWAEKGLLGVRRVVTATLSADHRASDGHRGSQFLDALDRHLQEPEKL